MSETTDFVWHNHGSLWTCQPCTVEAKAWVELYVEVPSYMWLGSAFVVEHRCVEALAEGQRADGFEVRIAGA